MLSARTRPAEPLTLFGCVLGVLARKRTHSQPGPVCGLYRGVRGGVLLALRYGGWGDRLDAGGAAERGGVAVRTRHLAAGRDGASRDGSPASMPQDLAQVHRVGVPGGQRLQPER